tara:strand:+ start:90398 stop:90835 length:438 start_codon:yes stop_codon:yes gene_type:complete
MGASASDPAPRPIVAVLAVVIHDNHVLLVQRANPPDAGLWGFPGGKVDFGEGLLAAAARELHEETGVTATPLRVIDALDAYDVAEDGTLRQHFALVAVVCTWQCGDPVAADDALDARWLPLAGLDGALPMSRDVVRIASQATSLV